MDAITELSQCCVSRFSYCLDHRVYYCFCIILRNLGPISIWGGRHHGHFTGRRLHLGPTEISIYLPRRKIPPWNQSNSSHIAGRENWPTPWDWLATFNEGFVISPVGNVGTDLHSCTGTYISSSLDESWGIYIRQVVASSFIITDTNMWNLLAGLRPGVW
jgi:hypothetical protein